MNKLIAAVVSIVVWVAFCFLLAATGIRGYLPMALLFLIILPATWVGVLSLFKKRSVEKPGAISGDKNLNENSKTKIEYESDSSSNRLNIDIAKIGSGLKTIFLVIFVTILVGAGILFVQSQITEARQAYTFRKNKANYIRQQNLDKVVQDQLVNKMNPLLGKDIVIQSIGMEFVWIDQLKIWVGKFEVTNGEYRKKDPSYKTENYKTLYLDGDRQPVTINTISEAYYFASWLNEQEQATWLPKKSKFRLPTEQEWLLFAGCGDGRIYPWGNQLPPKYGNYSGNETDGLLEYKSRLSGYSDDYKGSCSVELSGKNEWGLYGVGGNVWEATSPSLNRNWDNTWYGGSWMNGEPLTLGCDFVNHHGTQHDHYYDHGFRLVLQP